MLKYSADQDKSLHIGHSHFKNIRRLQIKLKVWENFSERCLISVDALYRNTEFNTESLDERHKKAICFLSEHMIESSNILEWEKNDYDNQKVPHGQEGPKKLNLLNYFDNFFIGCGRIFAKIWYLRIVLNCWYLRRFTLFSQASTAS